MGREVALTGAWAEARDKAEVEWEDHLPQDPVEIACALNAATRFPIS